MPRARILSPLLLLLTVCGLFAQSQATSNVKMEWRNVLGTYSTFQEIKPRLVNTGGNSIFLSRLYPDSSAHLQRYNETKEEWESGAWSITCGVVAESTIPIEIKPKEESEIVVSWQLSTDDWDAPKHFVILPSRESRPLSGKYRFVLQYALEPWTLIHHPSATYRFTSPEFTVTSEDVLRSRPPK